MREFHCLVSGRTVLSDSLRLASARITGLLVLLAAVLGSPVFAAAAAPVLPDDEAVSLLQKIQDASRELDYSGVFTYQQGSSMQSSRIVHMVDGTGERERLETLDGEAREYLRHNDAIQCLVPDRKVILLERRRGDRFPGLLLGDGSRIPQHYTVSRREAPFRVAGRECNMLELQPKDQSRYGYRICSDTRTRLLLKAQTIDVQGRVVDQVAFTTLQLGDEVSSAQLSSRWNTDGWRVLETSMQAADLSKEGWRIPSPSGFEVITQVTRSIMAGKTVNQLVLTDGLAAISVFIEPFDPSWSPHTVKGGTSKGSLNIFRTRIGDHWLTTIGEVPADTLSDIALHTEYLPKGSSQ